MSSTNEKYSNFNEVENDGAEWVKECLTLGTHQFMLRRRNISLDHSIVRSTFPRSCTIQIVNRQYILIANMREQTQLLKTEIINSQASVIRLQEDSAKDQQLGALQTAVVSSIEETVKTEFRSNNEPVQAIFFNCSTYGLGSCEPSDSSLIRSPTEAQMFAP